MSKIDFKKELRHLYNASAKRAAIVDVPALHFLMVDGAGDPNTTVKYQEAVGALFSVSYALKFMIKQTADVDYVVMPLEGLWWADDFAVFIADDRASWKWTMMIMQPQFVSAELFARAREEVAAKKALAGLGRVRFETFDEGLAAQILHIGPYSAEGPTIARLHGFIEDSGYELRGKHHEIYLSDPRRTAGEKLKTVLRQPIAKRADL